MCSQYSILSANEKLAERRKISLSNIFLDEFFLVKMDEEKKRNTKKPGERRKKRKHKKKSVKKAGSMYGSVGASNLAFCTQSDNQQTCCFASLFHHKHQENSTRR